MGWCIVCDADKAKHLCGGCRAVEYCSRECQKKDRPQHKRICRRFQDGTFRGKEFNCMIIDYSNTLQIKMENLSDSNIYVPKKISDDDDISTKTYKCTRTIPFSDLPKYSISEGTVKYSFYRYPFKLDSVKYLAIQHKYDKKYIIKRRYYDHNYTLKTTESCKISSNPKSKILHTEKEVLEKLLTHNEIKKVLNG